MHKQFDIVNRVIVPSDKENDLIDIYIDPDEKEKQKILESMDFDQHTLSSALDPDEISRIEFEKDYSFIIWKRPDNYSFDSELNFKVSSIGIILAKDKVIVILKDEYEYHNRKEFSKVNSLNDYLLKILFYTIRHFVEHIKAINMMSKELQNKINSSLENKYLIQMFNLSESLVYYLNAISANDSVLVKLHSNAQKIGFTTEETETLEDLVIENNQCYKQAEIYSTILSGLMDARGSIVNNNMNVLLKKLTIINVIFLPLTLIASIGGMSEFSAMTTGVPFHISYSLFGLGMILIGWLTALIIHRMNNRSSKTVRKRRRPLKISVP